MFKFIKFLFESDLHLCRGVVNSYVHNLIEHFILNVFGEKVNCILKYYFSFFNIIFEIMNWGGGGLNIAIYKSTFI